MDTLISPILNQHNSKSEAHYSSFPMTNHLHSPAFRLVSLHPLLSIWVSFLRVPEIPDEFKYKIFTSRTMTVVDVLDSIINELGLTKSSPIPGGGNLEYVLEEVWIDGANESRNISSSRSCLLIRTAKGLQDFLLLLYYSTSQNFPFHRIHLNLQHKGISEFVCLTNGTVVPNLVSLNQLQRPLIQL